MLNQTRDVNASEHSSDALEGSRIQYKALQKTWEIAHPNLCLRPRRISPTADGVQ